MSEEYLRRAVLEALSEEGATIPELVEKLRERGVQLSDVFYVNGEPTSPQLCATLLQLKKECRIFFVPETGKWYRVRGK